MKKTLLTSSCLLFSILLWMGNSFAKPVDTLTAKLKATNFMLGRVGHSGTRGSLPAKLVYTGNASRTDSHRNLTCLYIFNVGDGFVIMGADDRVEPVIGYSTEGHFDRNNIPENLQSMLDQYMDEIQTFLLDAPAQPNAATEKWAALSEIPAASKGVVVGPLLETTWDQNSPYNAMCPADASGPGGHVYAGCVATAMAQVIRYWEYPQRGIGQKSYTPSGYSQQTVYFANGTYEYANMPSYITSSSPSNQITQVARLTWHCGVSVEMMYGADGSGAYTTDAVSAFKNYFKYSTSYGTINPQYKSRGSYSDAEWINLLKNELNNWRPIIYSASSPYPLPNYPDYTVGHAFICDGYDDQGYFHFNWGWSGSCNGYYLISLLNPDDYNFYLGHGAVINLQGNTPLIKTNTKELSFLCPSNSVSEAHSLPIHGIALTNNIVLTAPANFEVSTDGTTFSSSLNVPNTTSIIYVRYAPTATGVTSDQGTLTLTSGSTTKTVTLYGYTYELDCNAPQNVQYSSDNNGNVQLSWDAPTQDIHSYRFSVDSTISGSRTGLGASNYIFAHRADISDLLPYHQKKVTQVSFYFSAQAAPYSSNQKIVIFQGGSLKNNNFDEGTLIREQSVASISSGWNTITLNEPVIIDARQEIWYGIQFDYNASGYCCPIVRGSNSGIPKKGDLVNTNGSWKYLGFYGYDNNIPLKITIQDSPSSITDYTIERNDNIVGTTTNTQYNDHVTSSGIYTYNVTANWDNGCSATSSDIAVNVITNCTTTYGDTTVSACEGFTWHDSTYTVTPAATPTFTMVGGNSVGCDSVVRLHLTINQKHYIPETVTVAQSSLPYNWHGHTFYADTTIYDSLQTTAGCDSVFFLTLSVTPFNLVQDSPIVLCQGETENWRGRLLSQSGIYQDTVMASNTIYSVVVTVNPKYFFPENVTVPQGSLPYNWHGHSFYTDTTIHDSLTTVAGCDSVFFLALTVTPFNIVQDSPIVLCQGETENWHGHQLSESGTYQDTSLIENTIHTVVVIVNPKYFFPENVTVNQGSLPYNWHGHAFYSDTIAYDSLKTVADCDSVYCLTLTVVPYSVIADTPIAFCEGKTETWRGHLLSQSGIFQDTIFASNTIHTVTVTVNPKYYFPENVTVPQGSLPYNWHGHSFYADTTIYDSLTTVAGCDSVFFLTLTITPFSIVQDSPIVLCQGETENWRGHLLSQSDTYRDTAMAENTIHTVVVTVTPKHFFPENVTVNQGSLPYNWHGHAFYADTIAYDSLLTTVGCDSVYCLTLTVVPYSVIADDAIVFCEGDPQTWRGHELTESREYRDTVPESNTIYTVQVTIKPLPVFTLTLENNNILCAHETLSFSPSFSYSGNNDDVIWSWEGPNGFTSSIKNPVVSNNATPDDNGDYSVTVAVTQNGCTKEDSATVHVTVHAPATGTVAISGSTIICKGSSTTLTASATGNTGDMTYEWSYGLSPISDSAATASPAYSTIYTVTATATVGNCTATTTKQIVVTVNPLPTVTIEGDDTICSGTSGTLTAFANSNAPQYSWSWNNGDTTQTTTINEPGTYSVTVTDGNGCQKSTSSTVTALPLPLAPQCSILPNSSCTSDNGNITVTNPIGTDLTYSIDGEHFQDSTVFQNLSDGSYTVTVKNSYGCINQTTVSVEAIGNTVDAQATANTPCAGEDITLFGNSNSTDVSYSWVGPDDFASDEQNPVIPNASSEIAGSYYLTVTQASTNCSKTVPVTVQVNTPSVTLANLSDTTVCIGGDILLNVALSSEPTGSVTYLWTSNNGYSSTQQNNTILNAQSAHAGTYEVVATASQTVAGSTCTVTDSKIMSVTVNPMPNIVISGENSTCEGVAATWTASGANSYLWSNNSTSNPIEVSEAGTYTVEGTDTNGCVNTASKVLNVNVPQPVTTPHTACESYEWHDSTYTTSGIYTYSHPDTQGCTQVDTLVLTINYGTHNSDAASECNQYTWNAPSGTTYITDSTSVLIDHYINTVNCPSADTLTVTIKSAEYTDLHVSVCENELPYHYINGQIDTTFDVGTPSLTTIPYTLSTVHGCDSTVTLHLTVNHAVTSTSSVTACDSYTWHDSTYFENGTYVFEYLNNVGCPSTDTLHLVINHAVNTVAEAEAIEAFVWQREGTSDTTITTSGTYTHTHPDIHGCMQTDTLHLTVYHATNTQIDTSACEEFLWQRSIAGDTTLLASGTYRDTLTDVHGADSVVTLVLTINPSYYIPENIPVMQAQLPYLWHGQTFNESATAFDSLSTVAGCDSVFYLNLTVVPYTFIQDNPIALCQGETQLWRGEQLSEQGTYIDTVPAENTIYTVEVTVNPTYNIQENMSVCESALPFTWHNQTVTGPGIYTDSSQTTFSCDSIHTLSVYVTNVTTQEDSMTVCGEDATYTWHNMTLSETGIYSDTLRNTNGCDSIVYTMNFVKGSPFFSEDSVHLSVVTLPYVWHGMAISDAGVYYDSLQTSVGCDSVYSLQAYYYDLLIVDTPITLCPGDTVFWRMRTITEGGTYRDTVIRWGDRFIFSVVVTMGEPFYHNDTVTICQDELPYIWHEQSFDTSGTSILRLQTVAGCDSIYMLTLTVNPSIRQNDTAETCQGTPYAWRGLQLETSGYYVDSVANTSGCEDVYTLLLTVNPTYSVDTSVTITTNDLPYHFVSGQIDTTFEVGSPSLLTIPYTLSTANGCDSIVTLHLTINVGIENHAAESLRAFPNPTTGYLTVIGSEGLTQLQLFDAYGRRVGIYPVEGTQTEIDLHGLASGVYFLKAMRHNQTAGTLKIIKNNE